MALSRTTHTGSAGVQTYLIGFAYLKPTYISVTVDAAAATHTLSSDGLSVVIGSPALAGGETIEILRTTDIEDDERLVDWETGSAVTEENLDRDTLQLLHLIQELSEGTAGGAGHVGDVTLHLPTGTHGDVLTWNAAGTPVLVTPGTSGQVLTTAGAGALPVWQTPPGAGGGEANTGSNENTGGGVGVFWQKDGLNLEFRGIHGSSGSGIAAALDGTTQEIELSIVSTGVANEGTPAPGDLLLGFVGGALRTFDVGDLPGGSGEANTASNSGTAGIGVWARKTGVDLEFKNLVGGTGITLSEATDDITIALTAGGVGNPQLANMPAWSVKARNAGTTGVPSDVTPSTLTEEASPEAGDFVLGWSSGGAGGGELRKFDISAFLGGGGGSITGGSNLPGGTGIYSGVTGGDTLDFRSLVQGSGIVITSDANTVTIGTTGIGGDITGGSNVNATGVGVFDAEVTGTLTFRGISAAVGGGLTVDFDDANNEIEIGIVAGGVTLDRIVSLTNYTLIGNPSSVTAAPVEVSPVNLSAGTGAAAVQLLGWTGTGAGNSIERYPLSAIPYAQWIANSNLANMAASTLKGRTFTSLGAPEDLTRADVLEDGTPAAGDYVLGWNSSNQLVVYNIGNLPAGGAGSDTTAIHDNVSAEISAIAEKLTPVAADLLVIEDSAASNAKKRVQVNNLQLGMTLPGIQQPWDTRVYFTASLMGTATTTAAAGSGTILYTPRWVPRAYTISNLYVEVTTATASGEARVAIYSDSNGVPGSLLWESGVIDCTTTGKKTVSPSLSVARGNYWTAIRANNGAVVFRAANLAIVAPWIGEATGATSLGGGPTQRTEAGTYGAFPSTANSTTVSAADMILIGATRP